MMIDGVLIGSRIYWTLLQVVTAESHRHYCRQSRYLVAASKGGRSSASELTSLQGGDHLTPTSHSDRWLQSVSSSTANSRTALTSSCQTPASAVNSRLASKQNWLPAAKLQLRLSILDWLPSRTGFQLLNSSFSCQFSTGFQAELASSC
jgi:hypothetical protein